MFPKGMGNMMKKAQEMQKKMSQVQAELNDLRIDGQSGGGMVKVVVNGKKDIISLNIDSSILKEDKEMVEDMVLAAIHQAMKNADKISQDKMGSLTGGLKIPGLF